MIAPKWESRVQGALAALLALIFLYELGLLLRPGGLFFSRPFIDDAFYSLLVARSLAHGTGLTIDGVHATNGVQPLICFLYAPLFRLAGGNDILALRLSLLLQVVLFALAALVLGALVRTLSRSKSPLLFWATALLVLGNYTLSAIFLNGLESGLTVCLIGASLLAYVRYQRQPPPRRLPWAALTGLLLGFTVLARIDALFLVLSVVAWNCRPSHWAPGEPAPGAFRARLLHAGLMATLAALVSAPWWIYNVTTFGSIMPTSGQALQLAPVQHLSTGLATLSVLSNQILLFFHLPYRNDQLRFNNFAGILILAAGLGTLALHPRSRRALACARASWSARWNLAPAAPILVFALLQILAYNTMHRAPHFQGRYLIVARLCLLFGLVSFGVELLKGSRLGRLGLVIAGSAWIVLSCALFSRNFTNTGGNIMLSAADWIEKNVRPGDSVGMFQSGTTEFLYPGQVVNLDGKVNPEALAALRHDALPAYVDRLRLTYLIDWPIYLSFVWRDPAVAPHYQKIATLPNDFEVWRRCVTP